MRRQRYDWRRVDWTRTGEHLRRRSKTAAPFYGCRWCSTRRLNRSVRSRAGYRQRLGTVGRIEAFCSTVYSFAWRFSHCIPGKLSRWRLPVRMLDTLYRLKMKPLPGYWDADHDRSITRNTRPSNAQCTNICISKSPTFSLRTLILLLASVSLAPNRKYTTRHFSLKTPVAPLCEWINRRAKRLNSLVCTAVYRQHRPLISPDNYWHYSRC